MTSPYGFFLNWKQTTPLSTLFILLHYVGGLNTYFQPLMLCVMVKSYLYSQNPKRTTFWPYGQKVAFFAQSCCAESQSYCADTWSVCGKVQPRARLNKWWNKFKKYVDSSNSCIIDEVDENMGYQG